MLNTEQIKKEFNERFDEQEYTILDRDEIVNYWLSVLSQQLSKQKEEIEKLKKKTIPNMLQEDKIFQEKGMDGVKGFNQVIDTVLSIIKVK